jgi:hypothetical protein
MSVPERASVTAKRAGGPDRREVGVVGSWNGTDRLRAAVGRQGRHRNAPAAIPRPLMTRPRRRQAKRVGALWDQAERRWYAPRPGIEALERRLPFVDLVTSSTRDLHGAPDMLQATTVDDQVDTVQPGTLLPDVPGLRGFRAVVADAVARVAVAGPGRLRKPANLTQAVHAPSGCWSPQRALSPGRSEKGETRDA